MFASVAISAGNSTGSLEYADDGLAYYSRLFLRNHW